MAGKIVGGLFHLVSAAALIWGAVLLFTAVTEPNNYYLRDASAVQVTQVYSEATYYAVTAAALFLLALLLEVVIYVGRPSGAADNANVVQSVEETNRLLRQIGRVLSDRGQQSQ